MDYYYYSAQQVAICFVYSSKFCCAGKWNDIHMGYHKSPQNIPGLDKQIYGVEIERNCLCF